MNIVFLGTPEIAKTCLQQIVEHSNHKVLAVITNPDRPAGRGNKLIESPVKTYALSKKLKLFQYEKIKDDGIKEIKKLAPDALVVVAFGQILSQEVLDIALPINLHGSLLPELRGPSPIQSAILEGKTISGVSIMKMDSGIDSGPILLQKEIEITEEDTSETLFEKMAIVGSKALVVTLDLIDTNNSNWTKQDNSKATYTKKLTKEDAKLNFNDTATNIFNKVRAYNPNPVAYFILNGKRIKVFKAKVVKNNANAINGTILTANSKDGFIIKCEENAIEMIDIQPENSKRMTAKQYLNGKKIDVGVVAE